MGAVKRTHPRARDRQDYKKRLIRFRKRCETQLKFVLPAWNLDLFGNYFDDDELTRWQSAFTQQEEIWTGR